MRDSCCSLQRAEEKWGVTSAQALSTLLADAESVDNAAELVDLYAPGGKAGDGVISIPFAAMCEATFIPVGRAARRPPPIDWQQVTRLLLREIGNA